MDIPQNLNNPPQSAVPSMSSMPVNTTPNPMPPMPSNRTKINKKLLIILVIVFLLLGSLAYAWFFTDLKYKLPWLKVKEDKLVGMMYEKLAQLDGADFALTYKLSIGDRDTDVKVEEKRVSNSEALRRVSNLRNSLNYSMRNSLRTCLNKNANVQAYAGKNCDGSEQAKPKSGEYICSDQITSLKNDLYFGSDGLDDMPPADQNKWLDLSQYEWEYDGTCSADKDKKTYTFSLRSTYNDDKIVCNEIGCSYDNFNRRYLGELVNYNFLFGEYLTEFEEYISDNFHIQATFSGSGFSLKEREEEKKSLPNVELSLDASADLGSISGKVNAAAKVIDDFVYYKIDNFPFVDLTQGHQKEWIQIGLEDADLVADIVPDWNEEQVELIKQFRDFVSKTKDYNVLEFRSTGKYWESTKHGIKSPVFEVIIVPENVPNWLDALKNIYQTDSSAQAPELNEAEKQALIASIKKATSNFKITVALNPVTGDLMNFTMDVRIIPPNEIKKFEGKQFNSSVILEMWNQNNPSSPKVPDKFIESSEIEREKLGLSKEAYNDMQQAERVIKVRRDLAKYYYRNRVFPEKLSEATKLATDYNTKKDYEYKSLKNNYTLVYQMNDLSAKDNVDSFYSRGYYTRTMGTNYLTGEQEDWDKGANTADRYSAVAHKYASGRKLLVNDETHYDKDVLMAIQQSKIAIKTGEQLQYYFNLNSRQYPSTLDNMIKDSYYDSFYDSEAYYVGENILTGSFAEYQATGNTNYSIKFDYPIGVSNLSQNLIKYNKSKILNFNAGTNQYNKDNIKDTLYVLEKANTDIYKDDDNDGLTNAQEVLYGTNPNKKDSDGDGYWDGEEVKNGYNPLGSGKLNNSDSFGTNTLSEIHIDTGVKYTAITKSDWMRGSSTATIILLVYSDLDCPFCRNYYATINKLYNENSGKIRLVYRHFPLTTLHPEAGRKAQALECVGEQGGNTKVWAFLDKYYASTTTIKLSDLGATVKSIGLDESKFKTCLEADKYVSKVNQQSQWAQDDGARGVPYGFLIKGSNVQEINGALPYDSLKTMVNSLLK